MIKWRIMKYDTKTYQVELEMSMDTWERIFSTFTTKEAAIRFAKFTVGDGEVVASQDD